ncbi:MAG TPA: PQQ-binding-like beta-propeller repeat protein [Bryobacteraceae bacterium]|jgi:glucose dehydrogenase|nr:PQQ-binding-like beta-propeller repeat protein [Bryobacteraceae bacterium]
MRIGIALLLTAFPLRAAGPRGPITPENVRQLKPAWTYDTGESPHVFWHKESHFETTPAYAEGKLYLSTPGGLVIALDAATGREIWKRDLHVYRDGDFSEPTTRGVTLSGHAIYAATTDARLGLANARKHLATVYSGQAALSLSNHPGGGAVVEIQVPA